MESLRFNRLLKKAKYDQKTFDELYGFYYPRIVRRLQVKFGHAMAEDCAQEFFLAVIDTSKNFGFVNSPTSWVYKCCENIAKRKISTESKYMLCGESIASGPTDGAPLANLENSDEVQKLLGAFDGDVQKIIYLVYWEGYNLKEVSEILHISYAAVRQKYARAMKKLKKLSQNGG